MTNDTMLACAWEPGIGKLTLRPSAYDFWNVFTQSLKASRGLACTAQASMSWDSTGGSGTRAARARRCDALRTQPAPWTIFTGMRSASKRGKP